jgi:CRISPR-associated protein Cst1
MLKYTGHPLVDVGVAAITAFAGKRDPAELTEDNLDKIADYIAREYARQPLLSFLTVAFPNSGFTQPAYNRRPEKRQVYAERVLRGYRADTPTLGERCIFTGQPAVAVPFDVKGELPPGHAFRQHIPLLTGEDVISFYSYGMGGKGRLTSDNCASVQVRW